MLEAALEAALVYEEVFLDNGGCNGMCSFMGRTGKNIFLAVYSGTEPRLRVRF